MAISWLSLARQYEAIERLFQGTGCLNQRSPLPKRQVGLFHSRIYKQSVWHPLAGPEPAWEAVWKLGASLTRWQPRSASIRF